LKGGWVKIDQFKQGVRPLPEFYFTFHIPPFLKYREPGGAAVCGFAQAAVGSGSEFRRVNVIDDREISGGCGKIK
jgi:hypothetical protein